MATIAFVHAHPDDEAIFTGGTMLRLAQLGHRVVLVLATGGELGLTDTGTPVSHAATATGTSTTTTPVTDELAARRRTEAESAAALLQVDSVRFLGFRDSGMEGDPANDAEGSFWSAPLSDAAHVLAHVLRDEAVDCAVVYDPHGIYGHPAHVQAHRVGIAAADLAGVESVYEMTVDREYLHFVETHLVEEAALAGDLGLARSHIGYSSVEIDLTVDVRSNIQDKRAAMAAHASQLPEEAPVFLLDQKRFAEVYGWEWYVRRGTPGVLDELS
ncbi:PIG-L family deacetylase [soil metagenome]